MSKSSGLHDASYAKGGSVLPRSRDFKKEADMPSGEAKGSKTSGGPPLGQFLNGEDRFTGHDNVLPHTNDEGWSKKGSKDLSSRWGDDKSEKPIKPRK